MYQHDHQIRVRYGETDQMGAVYHGFYALYYETGRTEAIRHLGLTYKSLEATGVLLPVGELKSKFIRPAAYDDLLTVRTSIRDWPGKKITFHTEIFREEVLLNVGEVTLVFVDQATFRPCDPPSLFLEKIQPFFENQQST